MLQFAKATWPDFEARRAEHIRERSAVLWADKLYTPLLLLHGGADAAVSTRQIMELAQKMDEAGRLYELIIYARDDHDININAEDRIRRTIDWFKNVRLMSIAQPLARTLQEQGIAAAIKQYSELKKNGAQQFDWASASEPVRLYLLGTGRIKEAVEIFKLNVAAYPQSFNTYDSLGEAYLADGSVSLPSRTMQISGMNRRTPTPAMCSEIAQQ